MKRTTYVLAALLVLVVLQARAQINPMGAQYFLNPYLANPAMAGTGGGFEGGISLKARYTNFEGSLSTQAVTATQSLAKNHLGLGLNFYKESAGVIKRTSAKTSYAYHLPVNEGSGYFDFGLSAGIMHESIDFNKVKGDLSDGSLLNFNERKLYFDGDFGMAFRSSQLTIQAALPNLKRLFARDRIRAVADRSLYMASVGYLIELNEGMSSVEPMVVYRGVQNYKDIVDVCANVKMFEDRLFFTGIYHSTNSFTLGIGTVYQNALSLMCQYTTNTSDLQSYSNGEFEIGIKYHFKKGPKRRLIFE